MPNITVLDQNTINKIAAGEVIERPASVVKELLENAIDSRATAVTVEIKDGGTTFVRVTDNGCGIPKEEIPLAFLRHSTSKIKSVEDLFTIASLGFRGEALSSIAAVCQVELITKTSVGLTGARYQIEGGIEKGLEEIGAPEGTTFIARNLFYNTPARMKFLKTAMTEGAHVAELVEKIALSHPGISIRFIHNNQNKLHTSGNHNLKDIIYTVFGREISSNLLALDSTQEEVKVTGFIGKPVIARGNRNYENYYINGRYIKSSIIAKAIEEAYKPYMMQHKYPFTLLHFTIQPEFLDINVHPTKMELRFRDGEMLYHMLYQAVSGALAHKELIPEVNLEKRVEAKAQSKAQSGETRRAVIPEPFESRRRKELYGETEKKPFTYDKILSPGADVLRETIMPLVPLVREDLKKTSSPAFVQEEPDTKPRMPAAVSADAGNKEDKKTVSPEITDVPAQAEQLDLFDGKLLEPKARETHKLIGQLFETYWLIEYKEQLFIIDQHAAHEKVLYERTMASLKSREYTSQVLNPPIILTLNMNEDLLLNKHLNYFCEMGFEIEHFGGKEYAVRGVPANLFSIAKKELLMEMIDGLSDEISNHNPEMIYEKVASMSCKAAVKGNMKLTGMEANSLIDQLLELENPYACPHGRPTIISMSKYELEKKFKRII